MVLRDLRGWLPFENLTTEDAEEHREETSSGPQGKRMKVAEGPRRVKPPEWLLVDGASGGQFVKSGLFATVRFSFAFSGHFERYDFAIASGMMLSS